MWGGKVTHLGVKSIIGAPRIPGETCQSFLTSSLLLKPIDCTLKSSGLEYLSVFF